MLNFSFSKDGKRSLAFSLDACHVGFYLWVGNLSVRIGGVDVTASTSPHYYPYVVPTFIGFGCVFPNYISWHTPFKEFARLPDVENNDDRDIEQSLKDCNV